MKEPEAMKAVMNAPCGYKAERGGINYPHVDCDWDCGNCDWNPKEHARRMETGTFVEEKRFGKKVKTLHYTRRFK